MTRAGDGRSGNRQQIHLQRLVPSDDGELDVFPARLDHLKEDGAPQRLT